MEQIICVAATDGDATGPQLLDLMLQLLTLHPCDVDHPDLIKASTFQLLRMEGHDERRLVLAEAGGGDVQAGIRREPVLALQHGPQLSLQGGATQAG